MAIESGGERTSAETLWKIEMFDTTLFRVRPPNFHVVSHFLPIPSIFPPNAEGIGGMAKMA